MEGENFILPGTKRAPSVFAAGCMFFLAVAGKPLIGLIETGLVWLVIRLLPSLEPGTTDIPLLSALMTCAYYLLFIILPFLLYLRSHPGMGFYTRQKAPGTASVLIALAAGVCGFYVCICANYLWCMWIEALGGTIPDSGIFPMENLGQILTQLFCTAVLPAVCEELLFRGTVLSACEERGTRRAIFGTALLFTLVHSRISGLPAEFISGLIMGYLVVLSGSLVTGILYHTVHNSMALILSRLGQQSAAPMQQSYYEAIGGIAGLTILSVRLLLSAGALYLLIRLLKKYCGAKALDHPAIQGEEKGVGEWAVWTCSLLLALALYVPDVLRVTGVLQ